MLASLAALFLSCAGILHSYCYMCRKLPAERVRGYYPVSVNLQALLNLGWILLAAAGFLLTYRLSALLGLLAAVIYFVLLPFLLQPPLARLLGFRSLHEYVETVDGKNAPED